VTYEKRIKFSWGSDDTQGAVLELWNDGIIVQTKCHGCYSTMLTDRRTIASLHQYLGDWLIEHPETVVPLVKDVPHDE
jgi:hypothetical protein